MNRPYPSQPSLQSPGTWLGPVDPPGDVVALIIDDDAWSRRTIAMTLRLEGYRVEEAPDAAEGIQLAQSRCPGIILCEMDLPCQGGFGVLEAVRRDPDAGSTPFIFLTAGIANSSLRAAMNSGADDLLAKPVTRADLLASVQARLRQRRMQEQRMLRLLASTRFVPDFGSAGPLVDQLGLTWTEAETLLWVAQGKSNADIAQILRKSEKTVKKTLSHVFTKLGLESRTAAALRAVEVLGRPVHRPGSG